jgi:hypothetical protein
MGYKGYRGGFEIKDFPQLAARLLLGVPESKIVRALGLKSVL